MAESVGTRSLTPPPPGRRVGPVQERHIVIVAFEGLQPLDAVGPHEVFAGATRAAATLGRAGSYRVTLASPGGGSVRAESGLVLGTAPLPTDSERIDTLVL